MKRVRRQLGPGFIQEMQVQCDKCGGKGRVVSKTCHVCGGARVRTGVEHMSVDVERGMHHGQDIMFEHAGDALADKAPGAWRRAAAASSAASRRQRVQATSSSS